MHKYWQKLPKFQYSLILRKEFHNYSWTFSERKHWINLTFQNFQNRMTALNLNLQYQLNPDKDKTPDKQQSLISKKRHVLQTHPMSTEPWKKKENKIKNKLHKNPSLLLCHQDWIDSGWQFCRKSWQCNCEWLDGPTDGWTDRHRMLEDSPS